MARDALGKTVLNARQWSMVQRIIEYVHKRIALNGAEIFNDADDRIAALKEITDAVANSYNLQKDLLNLRARRSGMPPGNLR